MKRGLRDATGRAFDGQGLIYGLGHAVYTLSDPRAELLRGFVERLAAEKSFGEALAAHQTVEQEGKALLEARTGHFFPSILRKKRLSAQRGIDNRGGRGYHGSTWHRNKK